MPWPSTVILLALLAQSPEVQVSPSAAAGTQDSSGPGFLEKKGFDLATVLAALYGTDASRVLLPPPLNDTKAPYDFVLRTTGSLPPGELQRIMREGIEKHFGLVKSTGHRPMDVYVMKADPDRIRPVNTTMKQSHMTLSVSSGEEPPSDEKLRQAMETAALAEISASGDIGQVRRLLEQGLHCPVVDETGLKGEYDLNTVGHAKTNEEFLHMLKDQTGLDVTPERRNIEVIVFTKR